jgi:hypothetical protein
VGNNRPLGSLNVYVKLTDKRALTSGGVTAELVQAEVVAVLKLLLDVAACHNSAALDKLTPTKFATYQGRADIIHLDNRCLEDMFFWRLRDLGNLPAAIVGSL